MGKTVFSLKSEAINEYLLPPLFFKIMFIVFATTIGKKRHKKLKLERNKSNSPYFQAA